MTYCVVPRDLAEKLYEPLREHYRAHPRVEVVVERRAADRRGPPRRQGEVESRRAAADRRLIRSRSGRRIAERRALTASVTVAPPLPKKARRHEARLAFVERLEPSSEAKRDADSKRLVTRYQAGEEAVFGELYLRYFNAVYSYSRVALGDHHDAEDVTQQVFVRAMSALDRYELRPNIPFRGWLFAIARNAIVDSVRVQHGLLVEPPEQIETMLEQAPGGGEMAGTLDWLTDREIAMFVERLPLLQRQVLVLRFMLDMSGEEIAEVLGRSHIAVRKLQSRALHTLERRLAAIGRTSSRPNRMPTEVRLRPLTVLARRRFALGVKPPRMPA
jgi:RNA polymerase sigma-70 factor (ECF subfamily)